MRQSPTLSKKEEILKIQDIKLEVCLNRVKGCFMSLVLRKCGYGEEKLPSSPLHSFVRAFSGEEEKRKDLCDL